MANFSENVIRVAYPTLWIVFVRVNRRLGRSARRTGASDAKAIQRLTRQFETETAANESSDDAYELIEHVANWLFNTRRTDAEFAFLFALTDDVPSAVGGRQDRLMLAPENLRCPSTWWYHDPQEALAA